MSGFSNLAISMSVICILAGGVTSFHVGLCSVGGAAIGLGWPLGCLFALIVAATMGQVASAFPTAGGLYHWAAILGGRGWGWTTAWFNLAGLITVLAAINVGAYEFVASALGPWLGYDPQSFSESGQVMVRSRGHGRADRLAGAIQSRRHPDDNAPDRFQRVLDLVCRRYSDDRSAHRRATLGAGSPGDVRQFQRATAERSGLAFHHEPRLAVPAGPLAAGVHVYRLRRLGAHGRGDHRCQRQCAARHRPFGAAFGSVRLAHAVGGGAGRAGSGGGGAEPAAARSWGSSAPSCPAGSR